MTATETMEAEYGLEQHENIHNTESSFAELSAKYSNMIHVLFDVNHISSRKEVDQLKLELQSMRGDIRKIEEAQKTLSTIYVPRMYDQVHRKKQSIAELQREMDNDVISKDSYVKWVTWLDDDNRDSSEKTDSMNSELRDYLEKRRDLAMQREFIQSQPQYAKLEQSTDPHIQSLVKNVDNIDYFLNALSFAERKGLLVEILAAFEVADADQALFAVLSKELDNAVGKYISAGAKNRWIARFNNPSASPKDKEKFVTKEFPKYVQNWKEVHKKYADLQSNSATATLTKRDVKKIDDFQNPTKFLALSYTEKLNLVQEVDNAITAKAEGKEKLFQTIKTIIDTAARAGYVSEHSTGSLVSRMMKGNRTPEEVENFVKNWAKVRFRYNEVERKINDTKVPQGFHRLSKTAFLAKKYKERELYVQDAEQRLDMESRPMENTPFSNAKGKVRHALDAKNWTEAEQFLKQAWPLTSSEKDQLELKSMERYLHAFKGTEDNEDANKAQSISEAVQEISSGLGQLPTPLRPIFERALEYNAGCVWTVGAMASNVQWCLVRGYLPRDLDSVRDTARKETKTRMKTRQGHSDGVANAMVDDFDKPAINEEPTGAQNFCVSSSKAALVAETANANQDNINYWYWTNLIVKGVSAGEYENVANTVRHKLTRAAQTLENNGLTYKSAMMTKRPTQISTPEKYTNSPYSLAS